MKQTTQTNKLKEYFKSNKAVFGLTSVQAFFAIILGVALLAYVIVIIMGTLSTSTILPTGTLSAAVNNESGAFINTTGYTLARASTVTGFGNPTITSIINNSGAVINAANYTLTTNGILSNASTSAINWINVNVSYTYTYNTGAVNNANNILGNTSSGITSFFGAISPVYSILAVLVIILVLVVLVRVVTGGTGANSRESSVPL